MSRLSFRQLLFAAFILTTGILTATSVQALLTLEHLARLGRETAAQAIALTEQSQRLSERTLAMERSARQFLVLDDPVFRERYAAARDEATAALQVLNRATPEFAPQRPTNGRCRRNRRGKSCKRVSAASAMAMPSCTARLPA